MSADSIKDFLVSLGFEVDKDGLKKFNDVLNDSEKLAVKFGKSMVGMAAATVGAVAIAANSLEKLYYSSQRIGASAANITAYEATIANMGGTAEAAAGSLEELARKMRNSPGYEGMLNGLGVKTKNANGSMRDRVEVMKDLGKALAAMPTSKANAYANALGLDEKTMLAMRDPAFTANLDRIQKLRQQMGMTDDLAKSGQQFSAEFRELTTNIKTIVEVIVMTAGKKLIPLFHMLNTGMETLVKWFSQINPNVKHFLANLLGWAAAGIVLLSLVSVVAGLYRTFKLFKGVVGILNLVRFAMKALNLTFLMNPIVLAIMAIIGALHLLWDDFQTWKNGGKSLIPWGSMTDGAKGLIDTIKSVIGHLAQLGEMVSAVFHGDFKKAAGIAKELMGEVAEAVAPVIKHVEQAAPKVIKHVTEAAKKGVAVVAQTADKAAGKVKQIVGGSNPTGLALLGDAISSGEGDYNSVNRGAVHIGGSKKLTNLGTYEEDLSKISINEALARNKLGFGDKRRMNAVGKYQIIASTMKGLVKQMGLTGNEMLTPEMQDKLLVQILKHKRKAAYDYITGVSNNLNAAQDALANEWMSIPASNGKGTHDGDGANKANSKSGQRIIDALTSMHKASLTPSMPYKDFQNKANSNDLSSTKTVSVSSTTTINVNGSDSPQSTAERVARTQQNTHAVLVRNSGNVVR